MAKNPFIILIADDHATNRLLLRRILEKEGYSVIEAVDGHDATAKLEENKIDIALLDVMMPGSDGFSVCRNLRKRYSLDELPILFITAKTEDSDLVEGFNAGGNDYITKPINTTILIARLRAQIQLLKRSKALSITYDLLSKQKRMETIGTFASGIAHNFNNILGTVLGSSELIELVSEDNSETRKAAELIIAASKRGAKLVESLLTFARPAKANSYTNPKQIIDSVFSLVSTVTGKKIKLSLEIAPELPSLPMPNYDLSHALMELMKNAVEAVDDAGEVKLSAFTEQRGTGEYVVFTIKDTGAGIPEHILEHLFEPFYSTKNLDTIMGIALDGSGLGLSAAHNLIGNYHGTIEVVETSCRGTTIKVSVPASARKPCSSLIP